MDKDELAAEVLRLTLLCQQDDATDDQRAQLDVLLADSAAARKVYLHTVDDTVTLTDDSASMAMVSDDSSGDAVVPPTDAGTQAAVGPISTMPLISWPAANIRNLMFLALVSCLLLGLGLSVSGWWTPEPAPLANDSSELMGRIVNLANVQWSRDATAYREWSRVSVGEEIRFDSGVVELILDNGAQIVLQGPVDFRLVSRQKAIVRHGQLVVRCGPEAVGFEIESPDANVIDLGTVFGVSIVGGMHTDVVVYDGAVDLAVRAADEVTERLTAGEALHIGRNGDVERITSVQSNIFLPPP